MSDHEDACCPLVDMAWDEDRNERVADRCLCRCHEIED